MSFLYRILPASFLFLFALTAYATNEVRDYPLTKIAAHTYVIHGPLGYPSVENQGFMNNPGFIITKDSIVIVDPGSSLQAGRMLLKQIKTVSKLPVSHVFNTHKHGDHWLGNQAISEAYPKAKIIGHAEMIKKLQEGEAAQWVSMLEDLTKGFTKGTKAVIPNEVAKDGAEYKVGGMRFRIYAPSDAHSHTDIMIEAVEDSVVFTGDNVVHQTLGRLDDATFKGNIAACEKIAAVNAKHYVPGHGPTGDVSVPKAYGKYLSTLYAEVKKHYDAGKADFEMKNDVIAALKSFHNWTRFEIEVGKHISLAILEIEANF